MLIGGSFSYLYFKKQGENINVVKSGCLKISLSESSGLKLENEVPVIDKVGREKSPYTVTLTNTCNTDAYFKTTLNVLDSSNTDNISKTKLAISGDRTINSLLISELMKAKLSDTPSNVVDTYLIDRGYIGVGESITYNIKLWIDYEATSYEGSLDTKVIVDTYVKGQEPIYLKSNLASTWKDKVDNELNYLALYTLNTKELPSTYTYNNEVYNLTNTVDVSEQTNGEVLLGEYKSGDKLIAVIGQEEGVIAPVVSSNLFMGLKSAKVIDVINLDTSFCTSLYRMFRDCNALEMMEVTFNTRNVTNLSDMFVNCRNLKSADISNIDEENLASFGWVFQNCVSLRNVNLSYLTLHKNKSFTSMFNNCILLEELDLTLFNTTNAEVMVSMFYNTSSLNKVKVGCNWVINDTCDTTNIFGNSKISEVEKICNG